MDAALKPLPVFPWPLAPERLALLREAKASLDLDYTIIPTEAVQGSPRILAFGTPPPWFSMSAVIRPENVDNPASIAAALRHALEADDFHSAWFAEEDWLSAAMGCEVRYSHSEDDTGKVYFE